MSGWPLQLLTSLICFECLFCISLPCNQTYKAKNGHLCYPCSPGYYTVSDCVVDGDQARCRRCGKGEYQPYCDNSPKCASCRLFCPPGQQKVKDCDAISDLECQCKAGSFWKPYDDNYKEGHCKPHSKCRPGEKRLEEGTPFEDTKCEPCREGVSYSGNSSLDSCKTCTVCSTAVIYKCTVTQDTVCSDQVPQLPPQTKNSSKGLGDSTIAWIVCLVIIIVGVVLLGLTCCIYRYRRNKTLNTDIESHKVDLSNTNANGENGISKAQLDAIVITTENPEDTKSANESNHSDESEECSVKSYINSQQSQEQFENDAFDSQSFTESNTQKESENNVIQDAQEEAECNQSPLTTIVNNNDPNTHPVVSGKQTDSTASNDENLKQGDANEQMQFPNKPKQSDYELKNTGSSQSCNKCDLPTDTVKNIDTPLDGNITFDNEKIKDDQLRINNGEYTVVSIDAASVSPRDSLHIDRPNREGVTEENIVSAAFRQNNTLNSVIESHNVALSNTNANGENGISEEIACVRLRLKNEQMQFPDKAKQSNYELKNTDTSQSCNKSDLPTDTVKNIHKPLEGKITSGNETIKDDQLRINNGEDTGVSIDAAAVSPRDSLRCGRQNREGVSEESMTEETGSGVRSQVECNFEDDISEKTCQLVDRSCKERMWFEIMAFISRNLQWDEFHSFIMQLVANTNGELLKTINVEINHAREEEKSIKSIIYKMMNTWRQATPAATVQCAYNALKDCSLKLKCEELEETLKQKGLLDRTNSSFQFMAGQNEETAQKRYLPLGECSAQNHREINHEMDELKEENSEIFC